MRISRADTQSDELGDGKFRYRVVPEWGQLPDGFVFGDVVGLATDSKDRAYIFNRGDHPVVVLDRDGRFIQSWGEGQFVRPHGICIGADDSVYCTDDVDHTVRKYSLDGRLLLKLGTSGQSSDSGINGWNYLSIQRAAPPFHLPTNLAVAPDGTLVISDGYGNARIHRFSAEGKLLHSWGAPGSGPGQFNLPHGIAVDRNGRVYVADRENSRVQIFSPDGEFIDQLTDLVRPTEVFIDPPGNILITEFGWHAGIFPWHVLPAHRPFGRVSIYDADTRLLARWGGGSDPTAPGQFFAPHDVWMDRAGDVYITEVLSSGGFKRADYGREGHLLQKFTPVAST